MKPHDPTAPPAQKRILRAALTEFAQRGFEAASTNAIAAAAGVAKGLVFHHFGNKEGLYVAVFDDVVARVTEAVFAAEDPPPADLFARLHALSVQKMAVFRADPDAFRFVLQSLHEPPAGLRDALVARHKALLQEHAPRFLAGLDAGSLRPGLSLQDAMETITLLAEGLERRYTPLLVLGTLSLEQYRALAWAHLLRLRDGVYAAPSPPREPPTD